MAGLFALAACTSKTSTPTATEDLVAVIQEVPASTLGLWRIGELEILVSADTKINSDRNAPRIGIAAKVEYQIVDDALHAVEVEILDFVPAFELNDGPYVSSIAKPIVERIDLVNGNVERQRLERSNWTVGTDEFVVPLRTATKGHSPNSLPRTGEVLIVSDVHGNYNQFRDFLIGNGVIDERLGWSFGSGQLVVVGDVFDRGALVTEILWLLYKLEAEASIAGGGAYLLLGNHEVMVMADDERYIAAKYAYVADKLEQPYSALFSSQTELGRWLRNRHAILRIGDMLFVHGGISSDVLDRQHSLATVNDEIRSILSVPVTDIDRDRPGGEYLAWNSDGVLWFRGNVRDAAAQTDVVDRALEHFGVASIVVGHTMLDEITDIYADQRVIAVGVPWTDPTMTRGLLVMNDRMYQVDQDGRRRSVRQGVWL